MYISPKSLKIIAAALLAIIFYAEYAISQNKDIPDSAKRKFSNILVLIIFIGVALVSCFGIFPDE